MSSYIASEEFNKKELISRFLSLPPHERLKQFLTVDEAAKKLELSSRTIRDWILYDKIIAIKVGERKQFIYWPSVTRYLEEIQDKELAAEDAD